MVAAGGIARGGPVEVGTLRTSGKRTTEMSLAPAEPSMIPGLVPSTISSGTSGARSR
jgi:hypothetical protein